MKLQPMNIITTTIMLGLQTLIFGVEDKNSKMKLIGSFIIAAGWILNIIAILNGG